MNSFIQKSADNIGVKINGDRPCDIKILNEKIYSDILKKGSTGLGEGYVNGLWECERIDEFFYQIGRSGINDKKIFLNEILLHIQFAILNMQNRERSFEVIKKHYDLDNELYKYMLGESMAYECAYWATAKNLDQAQYDKYDVICRKLGIKKGDKVLELGCGFGTFAKYASEKYGCEVVGVNISSKQMEYARKVCKGLPISLHEVDYRDVSKYNPNNIKFDKVVVIGLLEHVGLKNHREFFDIVEKNLKNDGLFLLHVIGRKTSANHIDSWMNKYIFPNALLPSMKQIVNGFYGLFMVEDVHNIGADYDYTLMSWFENFDKSWPKIKQRYDDKFYRMWKYYLLSCAGLFRSRYIQLWHFVFSKNGVLGGYKTIR